MQRGPEHFYDDLRAEPKGPWTTWEIDSLRAMWDAGHTMRRIAHELGRRYQAVDQMVRELNLPKREN
jgi:hypothetical protein